MCPVKGQHYTRRRSLKDVVFTELIFGVIDRYMINTYVPSGGYRLYWIKGTVHPKMIQQSFSPQSSC